VLIYREYPEFYKQLYAYITPELESIPKETALVFFKLVDRVLTSTHLSSTLLTSFVKRMAKVALVGVLPRVMLALVYNCLVRHPTLLVLIQSEDGADTYDPKELDPEVAGGGCLWEVKALMGHWDGRVAGAAKRFGEGLSRAGVRIEGALFFEDGMFKKEGGWKEAGVDEGGWAGIVDSL
jgi:U3 small nucleolar RNA-associated protein 19